jgi:REP element-mobilizing transposase RayT
MLPSAATHCDADRNVYLELLREDIQHCSVTLLGYCLMSNHIHFVLVPLKADGLAKFLKHTHGATPLTGTQRTVPPDTSGRDASTPAHSIQHTCGKHCAIWS